MHVYKPPRVGGLDRVPVFTAGTGSTRADLFELDGVTPMPDNVLVADTSGNLPSFQCATSPVYVGVSGSRTTWTPSESGEPSAASSALHLTKLAQASKTGPVTVTAGQIHTLDFAGAIIVAGDDYWGSPNTALPLGITISGSGIVLPDDDATYDLYAHASVTCDAADAGKMFGIVCDGNDSNGDNWMAVPAAGALFPISVSMVTRVFAGDGPYDHVAVTVDGTHLTQNATIDFFALFASKR